MSTKNMSRSLVEGGSRSSWQETCRTSTRAERRRWKQHCNRLSMDDTLWLDENDPEDRMPSSWGYTGKWDHSLSWLEQWLGSQVGRPWDQVRGILCRKYSRRSWRGQQIVDERLDWYVGYETDLRSRWRDFIVGRDGILRRDTDYDLPCPVSQRKSLDTPTSWPANKSTYHHKLSFYESLCGSVKSAYFIVVSGTYYWVHVTEWFVEFTTNRHDEEELIYHPERFALWRELTDEELEYLQSLRGHSYRNLRWDAAQSRRNGENSWRRYKGLEELPELTLDPYDKQALSAA